MTRTLSTLARLALPTGTGADTFELRERLDRAADRVGAQRVRRHLLDRELHRWWLEE